MRAFKLNELRALKKAAIGVVSTSTPTTWSSQEVDAVVAATHKLDERIYEMERRERQRLPWKA